MKKKDWIPFVSLMMAQTTLILGIGAFGFHRLEARLDRMEARLDGRMDRLEVRMDRLEQRVARIEGFLGLENENEAAAPASGPGNGLEAGSPDL